MEILDPVQYHLLCQQLRALNAEQEQQLLLKLGLNTQHWVIIWLSQNSGTQFKVLWKDDKCL